MRTWLEYQSTSRVTGDRVYVDRVEIDAPLYRFPLFEMMQGEKETWLVHGMVIRTYLCSDWYGGGHHFVYPFIRSSEIWIESNTYERERPAIYMAWAISRFLMKDIGLGFEDSHTIANTYAVDWVEEEVAAGRIAFDSYYPKKNNMTINWAPINTNGKKDTNPEADQIKNAIQSVQAKKEKLKGPGWDEILNRLSQAEKDLRKIPF